MYRVKGVSAGFVIFINGVEDEKLTRFLKTKKSELEAGELTIQFGAGLRVVQTIREICIDVYDEDYRPDLSVAYKC